jgi:transketolase
VAILAAGTMVSVALAAADLLAQDGISSRVLNMATIHPIDVEAIVACAQQTGGIVTVEESVPRGGLGGAVAEVVAERAPARMHLVGTHAFATTGDVPFLYEQFDLTREGVAKAARDLLARR